MSDLFPGAGAPFFGVQSNRRVPPTPAANSPALWRSTPFRVAVGVQRVQLFPQRIQVSCLEIFADTVNTVRLLVGSSEVTSVSTSPTGVPGNNYWQLDAGQHATMWTDDPILELFDVSMFWAISDDILNTNYLHCTVWQATRL